MKISVWNKKGGTGKTPLCISLSLDLNLAYYTNENSTGLAYCKGTYLFSGKAPVVDENVKIKKVGPSLELPQDCIFDFGGFIDPQICPLISISDFVFIPTINDPDSLIKTIETIKEVESLGNTNIIIIATKTENLKDYEEICQLNEYFDYPILNLKLSKIFNNVKSRGQSIEELYNDSPLSKSAYRDVWKQYQNIIKIIIN